MRTLLLLWHSGPLLELCTAQPPHLDRKSPEPNGATNNNSGARGARPADCNWSFDILLLLTPLLGAYIADTYLGRYKTILYSIGLTVVGHVNLTASAAPSVLKHTDVALAAYIIAIIIFGMGTGAFKPKISTLVAEQIVGEKLRVSARADGKKVIIDPAQTSARIFNWFYFFINVGALIGQLTMSYTALYVGYYLLLPTMLFLVAPAVLIAFKKKYRPSLPQGSVLGSALKLLFYATRANGLSTPSEPPRTSSDLWANVKPSTADPVQRPKWMTFDDQWVDEVRRGFKVCTVFLWYPLYWITYDQSNNNLTSQADTMRHQGVPPKIVSQLKPVTWIILIPICDLFIYPSLRRAGIKFTPIKKIALGFITGSLPMLYAAVVQSYIYAHNPCNHYPSEGLPDGSDCAPATVSISVQSGSYILIANFLDSCVHHGYAFTKASKNMRSMVQAFALFMTAIANANANANANASGEVFLPLSTDPLLVWNYGSMAVTALIAGCLFWLSHRHLDRNEDLLNQLPTGHKGTKHQADAAGRGASLAEAAEAGHGDVKDVEMLKTS